MCLKTYLIISFQTRNRKSVLPGDTSYCFKKLQRLSGKFKLRGYSTLKYGFTILGEASGVKLSSKVCDGHGSVHNSHVVAAPAIAKQKEMGKSWRIQKSHLLNA